MKDELIQNEKEAAERIQYLTNKYAESMQSNHEDANTFQQYVKNMSQLTITIEQLKAQNDKKELELNLKF